MFFGIKKEDKISIKEDVKREFAYDGFEKILTFAKDEIGIDFEDKREIIKNKIKLFCNKREIYSFNELYKKIILDNFLKQEFINLVTVSETYFFREEIQLDNAVSFIETLDSKISILSAPCSSGEEVFSLAMKMTDKGIDNFDILGVDINSNVIKKAQEGIYTARSVYNLSNYWLDKYFIKDEKNYIIKRDKFLNVSFKVANIFHLNSFVFQKFDIIFSRNMFIYFDKDTRLNVIKIFYDLLKDGGRLYLGHADSLPPNIWFKKDIKNLYYEKVSE